MSASDIENVKNGTKWWKGIFFDISQKADNPSRFFCQRLVIKMSTQGIFKRSWRVRALLLLSLFSFHFPRTFSLFDFSPIWSFFPFVEFFSDHLGGPLCFEPFVEVFPIFSFYLLNLLLRLILSREKRIVHTY